MVQLCGGYLSVWSSTMKRAEQVKQQTHTLTHSVCDVSESVCVCMCMCMSECGTVYECE